MDDKSTPGCRTVLVTGGTRGIGRALVERFAQFGDEVWFTDPSRAEQMDVPGVAIKPRRFELDLTSHDSVRQLVDALPGVPDIVIHNAALGQATVKAVAQHQHDQDQLTLQVNAVGILWLNELLVPHMVQRDSGKIVLFSSVGGGITTFPGHSYAYTMSKSAVATLGRMLAADLACTGIDVFTVCPGATHTPMFQASTLNSRSSSERDKLIGALPKGRMIEPSEIAELVAFICSEHGQVLRGGVIDASLGLGGRPELFRR